jgi:pyridoxamine 5'-phosphate oxidase
MDLFSACAVESVFADPLPADPLPLLAQWLEDARAQAACPNPDAMVLATTDAAGEPAARVVLCKGLDVSSGYLVFYSNYDSRKAHELGVNPRAAATFHWDHAGRQARVRGTVERSPEEESDAYFATRPVLSQVGAWASRQSEPLATREELFAQVAATMLRFGIDIEQVVNGRCERPIPRPPNWGGYRLWIRSVELWAGGAGRLHERVQWTRDLVGAHNGHCGERHQPAAPGPWRSSRLQP